MLFMELMISIFRGVGYPSLWPSKTCQQPLDVSNEFTFKVIDGILSGNDTVSTSKYGNCHILMH